MNWRWNYEEKWNQNFKMQMFLCLSILQKMTACLKENTKGVVDWPLHKEINVGVNHGSNQLLQWKPGIEMGLYEQKQYHLGL